MQVNTFVCGPDNVAPVNTLADRIAHLVTKTGLSQREFSRRAGLSPTHISTLLRRLADDPGVAVEAQTLEGIARVGGVQVSWLLPAGNASPASASPAPPPTSDVRITDDATDAIVNDAFNPARHKASDVPPVVEALQRTAALFRDNVDPVAYAARLLDAQAEARTKGRKVSPEELPFAALGMTERLLRISEEKNARDTAEARAFIEREGLPALKPGEVHPEIRKAQERERRRREGR